MTALPDTPTLLTEARAGVLHVTLNRPERKNAFNTRMVEDLQAVFSAIASDTALRAVVLRGAQGTFCAGADVKDLLQDAPTDRAGLHAAVAARNRQFGVLLQQIEASTLPLVVVLEGAVLGGGIGLACISDVALAMHDASFGLPETGLGLIPAQIAPFVVRRVGLTQARRLMLTGARFDGEAAARLGLVHEVCSDVAALDASLQGVLDQVRRCAPEANRATKRLVLAAADASSASELTAVLDDAAQRFADAALGPEAGEGRAAFIEKRRPVWST